MPMTMTHLNGAFFTLVHIYRLLELNLFNDDLAVLLVILHIPPFALQLSFSWFAALSLVSCGTWLVFNLAFCLHQAI